MQPGTADLAAAKALLRFLAQDCEAFGDPLPDVQDHQIQQFAQLGDCYREWNARINVISRKDMDHFFTRHVLHSLAMARILRPADGTRILDVGTGGGFPGIPLAILYPDVHFTLCDSIGKKIKVVQAVTESLGLRNVDAVWGRAESLTDRPAFDFVISRAVTRLPAFLDWVRPLVSHEQRHPLPNGVLYLKGGELGDELAPVREPIQQWPLAALLTDPWFETKILLHVDLQKE